MSKKSNFCLCPALGREISSDECGAGRHQTIVCPAECAHNTLAPVNYDAFLELETNSTGARRANGVMKSAQTTRWRCSMPGGVVTQLVYRFFIKVTN